METPSDGVIIHRRVKVKARANEIKCNNIIGGEPCGATVFWVTLLTDAIKIQCITCYSEQRLRGPGLSKAIKLLKANEKNKLLPIGNVGYQKHDRFKILTQGDENAGNNTTRSDSGNKQGT